MRNERSDSLAHVLLTRWLIEHGCYGASLIQPMLPSFVEYRRSEYLNLPRHIKVWWDGRDPGDEDRS